MDVDNFAYMSSQISALLCVRSMSHSHIYAIAKPTWLAIAYMPMEVAQEVAEPFNNTLLMGHTANYTKQKAP